MSKARPQTPSSIRRFTRNTLPLMHAAADSGRMLRSIETIVATDRWNSFDRFAETSNTLLKSYEAAGAKAELQKIQTGGALGSGRWIIPEAADVRGATLDVIAPVKQKILNWRENPWHIIQWSTATPKNGVEAVVVVIDSEEGLKRIKNGSLRGMLVLTRLNIWNKWREIYDKSPVGVISDAGINGLPDAVAWTKFGWGSLGLNNSSAKMIGFALSQRQGNALRKLIETRKIVRVRARVDVTRYAGSHDVVSGVVTGRDDPQDEMWAVAHSSEPGALDNASGVAACIEVARLLNHLIAEKKIQRPRRSIRLLHGYECYGFFNYLEHQKRFQPALAGICVDTIGAKPDLCKGALSWHGTIPMSATFVDDVGEEMINAALRIDDAGYHYVRKPFVTTEDTLLGDPKYGFPCPWISNHPFAGYHSSADTLSFVHRRGMATCTAAAAAYLYYLADAASPEVTELAQWHTENTLQNVRALGRKPSRAQIEFVRAQHDVSMERLQRWMWGGERQAILGTLNACRRSVADAAPLPKLFSAPRNGNGAHVDYIPRRTAPLAPTTENAPQDIARRLETSGLQKWAAYWADGQRSLSEIGRLISVELGREISLEKVQVQFKALADLGYVELIDPAQMISSERIRKELKALGIKSGMNVMIHSALSKVGHLRGGADAIIDALLNLIGKKGTLLAPSFNHFSARVFNPLVTPTTNGAIPEAIWRRADAVRSQHPSHAIAAIGPNAKAWCEGHLENGIWAANSPIGHLIESGGYVLSLGVDHNTTTAYHLAEIALKVPCLDQFGSVDRIVMPDGSVKDVRGLAWRAGECPVSTRKMNETLDRRNLQRRGKVGNADATLVKAIDVWKTRREHIKQVCPTCNVRPKCRR
jgi:aminoglycoside 3-N-acetyltransferase